MELINSLRAECCSHDLIAKTKDEALFEISKLLSKNHIASHLGVEKIYGHLKTREGQGSTGLGKGLALPHARIEGLQEFIVGVAISTRGVSFDAIDNKKCRIFFYILAPADAAGEHLKILAAISRLANNSDVQKELLNVKSDATLYEALARRIADVNTNLQTKKEMKLLYVILYFEDLMYDVLEYFLGQGIDGATILESSGMGQYISNVPLFAEFIGFMQERKNQSKTIMVLIPAERERQIIEGIEAITGDLDKTQGAMIISQNIGFYKGTMRMM